MAIRRKDHDERIFSIIEGARSKRVEPTVLTIVVVDVY